MDIYIKPAKKITVAGRKKIFIKDVLEIVAEKDVADKVNDMKILDITSDEKASYLISVMDIVKAVKKKYPDYTINNLGEAQTLVDYKPEKSVDNKYLEWIKILIISAILLIGSSTAIMSFHSDAQLPQVFQKMYEIFIGEKTERPLIIDIPYSIGLAAGIIIFFNHFTNKKITEDPTPIEVEMSLYDSDIIDTVVDLLGEEKRRNKDEGESK